MKLSTVMEVTFRDMDVTVEPIGTYSPPFIETPIVKSCCVRTKLLFHAITKVMSGITRLSMVTPNQALLRQ